jgi:hypothetical protein
MSFCLTNRPQEPKHRCGTMHENIKTIDGVLQGTPNG